MKKTLYFCDRCGKQIAEKEQHTLAASPTLDGAAETITRDLCPECTEDVKRECDDVTLGDLLRLLSSQPKYSRYIGLEELHSLIHLFLERVAKR